MRPIDLLSSRYNSIKPKGHDGGSSRWRARPVMAAAILLLMSLAVLLPAMVLAQANQAPTGFTAVPGVAENTIDLAWNAPADTNAIGMYAYCLKDTASASCAESDWLFLANGTDTEGMIDGNNLILGETYYVRIRAVNNTSVGGPATAAIEVQTGPAEVEDLTAVSGHQLVTLSWTTSDDTEVTKYQYRYRVGTGTWSIWKDALPASTDNDTTSHIVTALNNATEYTFQVRAYISQAASGDDPAIEAGGGAGEEMTATPGAPAALGTVTAVEGYQRIRLEWADPMGGAVTYEYRVSISTATPSTALWKSVPSGSVWKYTGPGTDAADPSDDVAMLAILISQTTGTNVDNTVDPVVAATLPADLINDEMYTLALRAVNDSGAGPASMDDVEGTPTASTSNVPVPQDLTASPGNGSVTLDWDAVTGYAGVGYQYCQKITMGEPCEDADGDWLPIPESNLETTAYEVTDLINKATLYFKLRSISNAEEPATDTPPRAEVSDPSDEVSAVVGAPARPTGLKAVIGNAKFRLNWTTPANNGSAITAYEYSTDGGSTWKEIVDSGPSTVMALITEQSSSTDGLANQYDVQLRAVNGNGDGQAAARSVTPSANPPAPTKLTATPGNEQVTLNWTAPSYLDVSGYEFISNSGGGYTLIDGSDTTTRTHTVIGLTNGQTTYIFLVRAVNGEVKGAASNEARATPGAPRAPTLTAASKTGAITLSWTVPTYVDMPAITRYEYRYTNVAPDGEPEWPDGNQTGDWAVTSATAPLERQLNLSAASDGVLDVGTVYYFQVRAVNEIVAGTTQVGALSNIASSVATEVVADWDFKIEPVDSAGNVVTNLVAGETELALRFTATYTVGTSDRGDVTSLWADFGSGTLMSAVPSATPQEVGFGSGVDAAPTASARLSSNNPLPICTANSTADTLTCVKDFAGKALRNGRRRPWRLCAHQQRVRPIQGDGNGQRQDRPLGNAGGRPHTQRNPERNPFADDGRLDAARRDGDGVRPH